MTWTQIIELVVVAMLYIHTLRLGGYVSQLQKEALAVQRDILRLQAEQRDLFRLKGEMFQRVGALEAKAKLAKAVGCKP